MYIWNTFGLGGQGVKLMLSFSQKSIQSADRQLARQIYILKDRKMKKDRKTIREIQKTETRNTAKKDRKTEKQAYREIDKKNMYKHSYMYTRHKLA